MPASIARHRHRVTRRANHGAAQRIDAARNGVKRGRSARVALVSMASGYGYDLAPRARTQAARSLRAHRTMPAARRLSA
ncbi:hypothetical protein C6P91_14555 [Burkholderia multivorans]|nr:hypothetical protein C6P91_14555 [Burkholderia multivorans]